MMAKILLSVVGLVFVFSSPASALSQVTQDACLAGAGSLLGKADWIDGTPNGPGSGLPYNEIPGDDAVVCLQAHFPGAPVDTAEEFAIEVANTASHELGHLLGLEHGDATGTSLMTTPSPFDGTDRGFSSAAEVAVLNDIMGTQVVFLDFALGSPELVLPHPYVGFADAQVLDDYGISGAVAIQAAIDAIVEDITADYSGPWTNGAAFSFHTTFEAALAEAGNNPASFSTVAFLGLVPEPGLVWLLLAGGLALRSLRRRRR